ncbi:photosystem II stability/assembly factor-like uncharacterized protein [Paenibacillus forsythiae]|uniref:Photosystem II stability/assembly factor-like uncharacterized protein n=1 Tax=Paenibacillus forsythiae TaxID=365616 RepID=A0ABU3H1R8_9BACL|nr:hypothetical protein [Paenibacillus forsythiae]MDT3424764.1 photosystem II stability/assembly factor-like uncharacterized protein [Paenibacillus forsythiae]
MPFPVVRPKHNKKLLITLLAALAVASCSPPPPETTPQPQPTETPEEGQTITLITPDAGNISSAQKSKYQIQTRLTDFQLLSDTEGLAWGVTKNALRLYLTRDSGKTWTNISPASTVQFTSNPVYGQDIFFTDSGNGWIIRQAFGMMETIVLRTRDGGKSWKISPLSQGGSISSIYFSSPLRGWLMAAWDSKESRESKALYLTEDGGATFKTVMQNDQYSPKSLHPAIPVVGVTGGMVFRDGEHGLVTLNTSKTPELYHSHDGGASWYEDDALASAAVFDQYDSVKLGKPEFFSSDSGWIPAAGKKKDVEGTFYDGLFTTDGGKTWVYHPLHLGVRTGTNEDVPPTFLDADHGWMLNGNLLYRTSNQGKTWEELPLSEVLGSKLAEYPEIVKLQFISKEVGWLLIEKSEDRRSILLQTTNGGVNWRVK